jgi:hypothetical protein
VAQSYASIFRVEKTRWLRIPLQHGINRKQDQQVSEVVTAITVFLHVTLCNLVEVHRLLKGQLLLSSSA